MPVTLLLQQPILFIAWIAAILMGIAIHEYAHAYAAYKLGDDTAASMGRLTLNPLAHIDFFGLLFLILVGFGWGKPVPVNENNLYPRRLGKLIVSLSGVFANILFAAAVVIGVRLFGGAGNLGMVGFFLFLVVAINLLLAVFNLLPIPPLDGSSILFALLPPRFEAVEYWLRRYGIWLLLGLLIIMNSSSFSPFTGLYNLAARLLGYNT